MVYDLIVCRFKMVELFQIILRTKGNNITTEVVEALSYHERCSMLNLNPVMVAKHFQYRVETFFRDVLLSNANPIGKIVYYAQGRSEGGIGGGGVVNPPPTFVELTYSENRVGRSENYGNNSITKF